MVGNIYKRAFSVLAKMPFKLWGLSLLSSLLTVLIAIFGFFPIITIPVTAVLTAGMAAVYLDGFRGKEVYSDQLFKGFKDFWRTAGGMCWKDLWILIWSLIPIVGPFIAIVKEYSYAFTPYILNEEKSTNATAALRKSMQDTNGYKLQMFCALLLPNLLIVIGIFVLSLLSLIPIIGVLFALIMAIVVLIYVLFAPMFFGLVRAGFYEYASNPTAYSAPKQPAQPAQPTYAAPVQNPVQAPTQAPAQPQQTQQQAPANDGAQTVTCPVCDSVNAPGTNFCYKCGTKLK